MRKYTPYLRQRIVFLSQSFNPSQIVKELAKEGFTMSKRGVQYLLNRYSRSGHLFDMYRSGRPLVLSAAAHCLIDETLDKLQDVNTN